MILESIKDTHEHSWQGLAKFYSDVDTKIKVMCFDCKSWSEILVGNQI